MLGYGSASQPSIRLVIACLLQDNFRQARLLGFMLVMWFISTGSDGQKRPPRNFWKIGELFGVCVLLSDLSRSCPECACNCSMLFGVPVLLIDLSVCA